MKTLGLIGGMSWESTVPYYQLINREVAQRLGGFHSAPIILYSVDFAPIEAAQRGDDWDEAGRILGRAGLALADAGADVLALATNTMHLVADAVVTAANRPLIHIANATAAAILSAGIGEVLLLGTRFTMERPFYRERLQQQGIAVRVPEAPARQAVDRIIFEELVHGEIREESRQRMLAIIREAAGDAAAHRDAPAPGVVLGCTEIGLLIRQEHLDLPLFDTTILHARALAEAVLDGAG